MIAAVPYPGTSASKNWNVGQKLEKLQKNQLGTKKQEKKSDNSPERTARRTHEARRQQKEQTKEQTKTNKKKEGRTKKGKKGEHQVIANQESIKWCIAYQDGTVEGG